MDSGRLGRWPPTIHRHGAEVVIERPASSVAVTVDVGDRFGDEADFCAPSVNAEGERLCIVALIETATV